MSFALQNITVSGGMAFTSIQQTGSITFNGASQYLLSASNAALTLGTGDFTVECWWYQSVANNGLGFLSSIAASGLIGVQFCGDGAFTGGNAGGTYDSFLWTLPLNQWNHVALVRISGTCYAYVNGVLASSGPTTLGNNLTNTQFAVGVSYTNNFTFKPAGYISNVRIVKGLGVYTGNFTPSNHPLTSTQSANQNGSPSLAITGTSTSLLLTTPNTTSFLTDSSSYNITMTNPGLSPVQALNPFNLGNPGSILFNGTNQYLSVPNATSNQMGSGDWTAEAWVYLNSYVAGVNPIFGKGGATTDWFFAIYTAGQLYFGIGATDYFKTTGPIVSLNAWHHVALVRSGTTISTYVDGVLGNTQTGMNQNFTSTGTVNIGRGRDTSANYFGPGYIANARLVKGVALYTGGFIPPTEPLTPVTTVSNTQLLLKVASAGTYLTDSSTNNYTLTPTGTVTYNASTPMTSGGSLLFDQTVVSYLTVPSSTVWNLTGDFTIQAWVNMTTLLAGSNGIIDARVNGGSAAAWLFHINGLGQTTFFTGTSYSGATTISTGVWNHVAVVRTGSKLIIYLNGAADYVNANFGTGAISPGTTSALIGTKDFGVNAQYRTINYITNLQFVNGTALYTQTSFTPPPGPLSSTQILNQNGSGARAITGTQTSLLLTTPLGSGYITDTSTYAATVTNNGTATSQSNNPFSL